MTYAEWLEQQERARWAAILEEHEEHLEKIVKENEQ
jgi:hypothetical protein